MYCKFWYTYEAFKPCPLGVKHAEPSVLVVGDSHALGLAHAFHLWLQETGRAGELWYLHGCIPTLDTGRNCPRFMRSVIDRRQADPAIDHVVLVSKWDHDPNVYDGTYLKGVRADAALEDALSRTLDGLAAPGRTLVLLDPLYGAPAPVADRIARNLYFGRDLPVDKPVSVHSRQFETIHHIFAKMAKRPDVTRISLIEGLCRSGTCPGMLNGTPLFFDRHHTRFGVNDYFAEVLAQQYAIGETTRDEE